MPFISIIIPAFNEEKYLLGLLTDIRSQRIDDMEVIVSDGKSKDHTVEIAKKFSCIVVLSDPLNPQHQRNQGAKVAKGDILFFIDADTRLPPDFFIKSLSEFQKKHLDVAGYYFKLNSPKFMYRIASIYGYIMQFIIHFFHPISVGAALICRKSYLEKIGGFNEALFIGDDHALSRDIQKVGGKYDLITTTYIWFSTRRFEKEGFWTVCHKWHYFCWYYLLHGDIKHPITPYKFGKF